MTPPGVPPLACPVCGRVVTGPQPAPCPGCGLPAVGPAALVVARIGATLGELSRDRDALLATLRASAAGPAPVPPALPLAPPPPPPLPAPVPPRRLSPQQVLLGLGGLLLVAGAVAFVAVSWSRLGLAFQASVLLAGTAAACAVSAGAARRGLRATEEALAATGATLLGVDLGGAWAKDLFGLGAVPLRLWAAAGCLGAAVLLTGLARLTRTTATWPLAALLALQPAPLLLLGPDRADGAAGVAAVLALAVLDLAVAARLRRGTAPVGAVLAGLWVATAQVLGLVAGAAEPPARGWAAAGVLAGAALVLGGAVLGGAALGGRVPHRRWVATAALGQLVVAAEVAVLAAGLSTPEAYTLPVAAGLLLAALPQLRVPVPSWAVEGPGLAVALVPSALLCAGDPGVVRLSLVLVAGVALTAGGALAHRQAPFVLGAASLAFVVLSRLYPYAPLVPRWLLLTAGGLVLLAVGAGYERRRQQAREAVAWVAQMR
jgi:hypothetical protein